MDVDRKVSEQPCALGVEINVYMRGSEDHGIMEETSSVASSVFLCCSDYDFSSRDREL